MGEFGVGAIFRLFLQSAKNILNISYVLSSIYYTHFTILNISSIYYPHYTQYILKSILNILSIPTYVGEAGVGAIFRLFLQSANNILKIS